MHSDFIELCIFECTTPKSYAELEVVCFYVFAEDVKKTSSLETLEFDLAVAVIDFSVC